MTAREFASWVEFYRLYPFDDLHTHYRPAALVAASMAGGDVGKLLEFMQPDPQRRVANAEGQARGLSSADMASINALIGRKH